MEKKTLSKKDNTDLIWPKRYNPSEIEIKWQKYWEKPEIYEKAYKFNSSDSKQPQLYLDTPPPYTSGDLHMGHAYWNILNDILARYYRMQGYNVLFPQGWDCQGLPTELKVQNIWKISRNDKTLFKKKCKEWTELMITNMKTGMKRLGYRPDWEQFEYRTMDNAYSKKVQLSLLDFYNKGLIYQSEFPVHWCPKCETALAQAELGYIEEDGYLYNISFSNVNSKIDVATTRPELLHACQALIVHPDDSRYKSFINTDFSIPLFNKKVPVITDSDVDPEFGTGVVMICTFGDEQDIKWQQRYNLNITSAINEQGHLINSHEFNGLYIKKARKIIAEKLEHIGALSKKTPIKHNVLKHTERQDCLSPVEFLVKKQWLIKTSQFKNKIKTISDEINWTPNYMKIRLFDWIDSIEWDWVISRQRIYGTPIPFWVCNSCNNIIPPEPDTLPVNTSIDSSPINKCNKCSSTQIQGTEDICDVWVDSSITPLINTQFYESKSNPINLLNMKKIRQQGHDIIRTWLYYTILRCFIITGSSPFEEVIINGHILGPDGYSMSKSKGNVVNPIDGINEYGADSLRQSLLSITIGSDFSFKWENVKFGKNFLQKIWSACRFSSNFIDDFSSNDVNQLKLTILDQWILTKLSYQSELIAESIEKRQLHKAIEHIQNFFWHEFCDHYLETVKSRLYQIKSVDDYDAARGTIYQVIWTTIRWLAPICPHITEEIYDKIFKKTQNLNTIHMSKWPNEKFDFISSELETTGQIIIDVIAIIRNKKSSLSISLKDSLDSVSIYASKNSIINLKKGENEIKDTMKIKTIHFIENDDLKIEINISKT